MRQKGFGALIIIFIIVFCLIGGTYLLNSYGKTNTPVPSPTPSPIITLVQGSSPVPTRKTNLKIAFSKDSVNYFLEIAIGTEFGGGGKTINKWIKPVVAVKQNGDVTPASSSCLSGVITDFNALSREVKLELRENQGHCIKI